MSLPIYKLSSQTTVFISINFFKFASKSFTMLYPLPITKSKSPRSKTRRVLKWKCEALRKKLEVCLDPDAMKWEWEEPLWHFVKMSWDFDEVEILHLRMDLAPSVLTTFQGFSPNTSADLKVSTQPPAVPLPVFNSSTPPPKEALPVDRPKTPEQNKAQASGKLFRLND
jgi:hypothetical protein